MNYKSKKSQILHDLRNAGIPVPAFKVVQFGETLPNLPDNRLYAVRSAPFVSQAGILESILNVEAKDVPNAVQKVFASWNSPLALKYRRFKNLPDEIGLEVIIQQIVSPKNGGISGILHTSNPVNGKLGVCGTFLKNDFADKLCKGEVDGEDIRTLHPEIQYTLLQGANGIEKFYRFPQDIEFVIDSSGKFWVVQVRAAQLTDYAFFKWCSQVDGGIHIAHQYSHIFDIEKCGEVDGEADIAPIGNCVGVSGDVLEGEIGVNVKVLDASDISQFSEIFEYQNIILRNGDIHNHFAVEARKAKKNCVIWNRVPPSGSVWIDVKSGLVFPRKPNVKIVNKLKINLGF